MGKYKQWLHHQEIGRRLRDQINTYEQERGRVQKMAPSHQTSLPELENPIIAALLAYTRSGNKLSNIDVIKAAMPKIDPALEPRRPASSSATAGSAGVTPTSATPGAAAVAGLQARAASIPADPLEQMRELSRGQAGQPNVAPQTPRPGAPAANPAPNAAPRADSVGGWWQRQRSED
jgi:hypothetical protein